MNKPSKNINFNNLNDILKYYNSKLDEYKSLFKYFLIIFLKILNLSALEIKIINNQKLNLSDIQILTKIDIERTNLDIEDINIIIKDLYKSDLIYNISYKINGETVLLKIDESKLINDIFFW